MKTEPLRGKALIVAAVNKILANPKCWEQSTWHCNTTHCIAGHCQILGGNPPTDNAMKDMAKMLGITDQEAQWLSQSHRSLSDIHGWAKSFIEDKAFFNPDGYDRDGYNRDGYDRAGYNRAGYDRDGYDRAGYDRDGYNPAGYNRDGYDRAGYDRAGYNRAGYNRAGYDRAGKQLEPLSLEGL